MKQLTQEIANDIRSWIESDDVKSVLDETTKASDSDLGSFSVVISTENIDRYQEVIKMDGWELEHYKKNPIVLWAHDHKLLPIGYANTIDVNDGKLVATGRFAPHAHAQEIRKLYDLGIVRATSVGFIAKEYEGNLITKAELLEFSFVSVPANPYALALAMKNDVSVNEMVTKGFFTIEEKDGEDVPDEVKTEEEPEVPATIEEPVEEKNFNTKAIQPVIAQAKGLVAALEALVGDQEPEGGDEPEDEVEDEKGFLEFSEKRKLIQDASTVLGDVLAEARRAIKAQGR